MERSKYLKAEYLGLRFSPTSRLSREHFIVLKYLISFCFEKFTNIINYDHMYLTIPKVNLPLVWKNQRYDISFLYGDRLILIRVDTFKLKDVHSIEVKEHGEGKG